MDIKAAAYLVVLFSLSVLAENAKNATTNLSDCVLGAPSNLTISEYEGRMYIQFIPDVPFTCFGLHKIEIFLNSVHSQTIRTMRPDFLVDLPKPCTTVRVLVSTLGDDDVETVAVSATYQTEIPSEFGMIENRYWMVDPTRVIVTYFPPHPYEECAFRYEVVHKIMNTETVFFNATTTELIHMFNYVEAMMFCKITTMYITPILNQVRGATWLENAVFDKFEGVIGPVSSVNLNLIEEHTLSITWTTPLYYEACPLYYTVEIINVISGQTLDSGIGQMQEWNYDYSETDNYCTNVAVRVTALKSGLAGTSVTRHITLGPPTDGSC